jgi:diguanylate cyclase (GGDEF)-like protein
MTKIQTAGKKSTFAESSLDVKKRRFYLWANILGIPGVLIALFTLPLNQNPTLIIVIIHMSIGIYVLSRPITISVYQRIAAIGLSLFTLCYVASTWLPLSTGQAYTILSNSYKLYFLNLLILNLFITNRSGWEISVVFTTLFSVIAASRVIAFSLEGNATFLSDFAPFLVISIVTVVVLNVFGAYREELVREKILSSTDPLTGAQNRRSALEKLETLEQNPLPFSVILLDLDHFKKVNDQYGHEAGDDVLTQVVQIAQTLVGKTHTVRWGGEEFLLMLPGTTLEQAYEIAEKLRALLEAATWKSVPRVTASLGVVQKTQQESYSQTLMRADVALYAAKNGGRNQVKMG